jgi:hypothetical protein
MAGVGDEITAVLLIAWRKWSERGANEKGLQCNCCAHRFRAGFLAKMAAHSVVASLRKHRISHPFETRLKFLEIA